MPESSAGLGSVRVALAVFGTAGLALGLLLATSSAQGGVPAEDTLPVTALVGVTSRLGSEVIPFEGTVTIARGDPRLDGGVQVVDLEIVDLDLVGQSLIGTVTAEESQTTTSVGEFRSLQPPPDKFPASSFFDVFFVVSAPASPSPTITLRNVDAIRLVPTEGLAEVPITAWPPAGVTYGGVFEPCVALVPTQPAEVCVTSVLVTFGGQPPASPTPTEPLDTATPTPSATARPSQMPTAAPPTSTPAISASPTAASTPGAVALPATGRGGPPIPVAVAWPSLAAGVAAVAGGVALLRAARRPLRR